MKLDRERTVSELVAFSRSLGETMLAKRLTQDQWQTLNQRVKLYRDEGLTKLARDLQVEGKTLIAEQRHHRQEIVRLRKSVENLKRKLLA